MRSSIVLKPELFSDSTVYISPNFVVCERFVIRKSLLSNAAAFSDVSAAQQEIGAVLSAELPPVKAFEPQEDSAFLGYFTSDNGEARAKLTRTPWFISDKEGDAVLYTTDDGRHFLFERALVDDLLGVDTLYCILNPDAPEESVFTDVPDSTTDGNFILSACAVQLPPPPNIAAWGTAGTEEAKPKKPKKAKKSDNQASVEETSVPASGAPNGVTPPASEGVSAGDEGEANEEYSLGAPTLKPG